MFLNRAVNLARDRDFVSSKAYFDRAIKLEPSNAETYYETGEMYFYRARIEQDESKASDYLDEARLYFTKAIERNFYNAKYYVRMADLCAYMHDYENAEMYYNKIDLLAPNFILYHLKKIKFYIGDMNKQDEKALDEFTFLLDNFHQFTFQNREEKEHLLYGLRAHLEKITPSKRFYDIKERIFNELAAIAKN